jgi:bacterial/archaeal transporter family protein
LYTRLGRFCRIKYPVIKNQKSCYYYAMTWYIAALLSAVFAALTSILAKIGIKDVGSNLATAIRTTVILFFTWGIVFFQGSFSEISKVNKNAWIFLVLSGIATGLSWLFYFYALKVGEASKVVPIDKLSLVITIIFAGLILHEKITLQVALGAVLMTTGALVIALAK